MIFFSKLKSKANAFLNRETGKQKFLSPEMLIQEKCILGFKSVVYNPEIIVSHNGDRNSICIGENTHIQGELMTFPGGKIKIGDFCYVGVGSRVWSDTLIEIGNRVLIAHNVNIFDNQTHPLDPVKRHNQFVQIIQNGFPKNIDLDGKLLIIEDDVWIACNSVILRGLRIGKCSVIAAGSVVTKDVPPYTVVAGNPAKMIKKIEPQEDFQVQIESMSE